MNRLQWLVGKKIIDVDERFIPEARICLDDGTTFFIDKKAVKELCDNIKQ